MKGNNTHLRTRRIVSKALLLMIVVSVVFPAGTGIAAADTGETYNLEWSTTGTNPSGVAMDSNGNAYVVEYPASSFEAVQVTSYNPDGTQRWSASVGNAGELEPRNERIAVNQDGVFVISLVDEKLYQISKSDGSTIDNSSTTGLTGPIEVSAAGHYAWVAVGGGYCSKTFDTSSSGMVLNASTSFGDNSCDSGEIDDTGDYFRESAQNDGTGFQKRNASGSYQSGGEIMKNPGAIEINTSVSDSTNVYAGNATGYIAKAVISSDTYQSLTRQQISGSPGFAAAAYDEGADVVSFGGSGGDVYVRNASDLSAVQKLDVDSFGSITGIAMTNRRLVAVSEEGTVKSYRLPLENPVTSINLTITDKTIINGQRSDYNVIGTQEDGNTVSVTSESTVTSNDTNVASVDSGTFDVVYQGDGTAKITASYTNDTGSTFTDSEVVETDTPEINLTVSEPKPGVGDTNSYTVTNTTFGTTTDVTDRANVFSLDTSIVTVDEANNEYTAQQKGTTSLDASDGSFGEDEPVEITVLKFDEPVTSIDLTVDDKTLANGESSSYDVIGTQSDSTTENLSFDSNTTVSSNSPAVVSVDEANLKVNYQGDGTATVRAEYTNRSGDVLADSVDMETDTKRLLFSVEEDKATKGQSYDYTAETELFGNVNDVTGSVSVSSSNSSIVSIQQAQTNYTAEDVGTATLTASYNSLTDSKQVEVDTPITWEFWNDINSGEKMVLIFSDWTVLYLFASLVVSGMAGLKLRSSGVALGGFSALVVSGWGLGFLPNYVTLSLVIFLGFLGFLIEWQFNP